MLEKIKQIRKERKKEREISAKAKVGAIEKELEKLVKPLMKKTGLTKEEAIIHLKAKRRKRETVESWKWRMSEINRMWDKADTIGKIGENIVRRSASEGLMQPKKRGRKKHSKRRERDNEFELPDVDLPELRF